MTLRPMATCARSPSRGLENVSPSSVLVAIAGTPLRPPLFEALCSSYHSRTVPFASFTTPPSRGERWSHSGAA